MPLKLTVTSYLWYLQKVFPLAWRPEKVVRGFLPKIRQKVVGRFVFLGFMTLAWNGCATKGTGLLSTLELWGEEPGDAKSEGETFSGEGLDRSFSDDWDMGMESLGLLGEEETQEWPEWEALPQGWKKAMRKRPLVELEIEDHPAIDQHVRELRQLRDRKGGLPLSRASKYLPRMREIFREEGVPEDLVYLAFVESGFNPWLSSPGKCVGIWQLTEGTARRYGLRIDSFVDERRDPERSTRAAARYLRDLYENFRSWDLAIAAYNAGEMAIARSMEAGGGQSFWDLYRGNRLRRATKEFVPKVIAAIQVAREEEDSLGLGEEESLWRFDRVRISQMVDLDTLASLLGCSKEELRNLNPQLKSSAVHPGSEGLEMRVPEGKGEELRTLLMEKGPMVHLQKKGPQGSPLGSSEAKRAGTQMRGSANGNPKENIAYSQKTHSSKVHVVQKGETLWAIARKYGVAIEDLMRWNGLKGYLVRPGEKLAVRTP